MRAGETAESIAGDTGWALDKVTRYAEPLLAERAYIAEQAQSVEIRRSGGGATLADTARTATGLMASGEYRVAEDWPQGMPRQVFAGFAAGLRDDWRGTIDRFIALEAFGSDHMREELRMLRDAVLARGEPATHVLAEGLRVLEDSDLRAALPALSVPSLWIAGRRDRLVNPQAMRTSADIAPDARFVQVEHAGHAPFLTHADEVAGALLGFLAEQGA